MTNKKLKEIIIKYCTGCGLCQSVYNINLHRDNRGFLKPILSSGSDIEKCSQICPFLNKDWEKTNSIWGNFEQVLAGWSNEKEIRYSASSGGVITSLLIYLLESGKIDAVLHIGASMNKPWQTQLYCSTSRDDIISHCGSRYATSHPLMNIGKYLKDNKKYAFVGRPCDMTTLKRYEKINPEITQKILYKLTFFCGAMPSEAANKKLIHSLVKGEENCQSLNYRGNGWPGCAVVTDFSGDRHLMSYENSWGKILGRDIMDICRFCFDAVGENGDISCGDAWYLKDDGFPDFSEHDGRNVILARTDLGKSLLEEAADCKYIVKEEFDISELEYSQAFQMERRKTMLSKIIALKLFNKPCLQYDWNKMINFSTMAKKRDLWNYFKGTVKRILIGKI